MIDTMLHRLDTLDLMAQMIQQEARLLRTLILTVNQPDLPLSAAPAESELTARQELPPAIRTPKELKYALKRLGVLPVKLGKKNLSQTIAEHLYKIKPVASIGLKSP